MRISRVYSTWLDSWVGESLVTASPSRALDKFEVNVLFEAAEDCSRVLELQIWTALHIH